MHCPCLWVESFVVFHALTSLARLPPLSGLASVCFEDKYTQHLLGVEGRPRRRVGCPRQVLTLGAKGSDCLGDMFPWLHLNTGAPWREGRPGEVATPLPTALRHTWIWSPVRADTAGGRSSGEHPGEP